MVLRRIASVFIISFGHLFLPFIYFQFVFSIGDHTFSESKNDYITDWCYNMPTCGEDTWIDSCAYSTHQSPINLPGNIKLLRKSTDAVKNFPKTKLIFDEFDIGSRGHGITIKFSGKPFKFIRVLRGFENITYTLHGLDFHWGKTNNVGSEHTIHRRAYPGEIHLGFYDATKVSPDKLITKKADIDDTPDILVIGAFLDVDSGGVSSKYSSSFLAPIVAALNNLQINHDKHITATLNLQDVFRGNTVYKYSGSFTAPSCRDAEWWVLRQPVIVPLEHLKAFRRAKVSGAQITGNNYRSLKAERIKDITLMNLQYD